MAWVGGSTAWGRSLSGASVTSASAFANAASELRSAAGRSPAYASSWSYPPMWSKFDAKFAMVDNSSIGSAEDGSADNTLAALAGVQAVRPLVVIGMPLSSILNGTLLDNSTADYWRSRWEQYKHVYAFSRCAVSAFVRVGR